MLGDAIHALANSLADAMSFGPDDHPDVLIVGAGPAGLTAATYLGRFRRRVLVADGGPPRACWIPVSHNMAGFPEGITGEAILKRMRDQALEYGAVIEAGCVEAIRRDGDGFVATMNGRQIRARAVLLATGVVDHHPDLPGVEDAIKRSLVRICPICDAYEAIDKSVAIIGRDDRGIREAAFMRTYTDRVTLIHVGPPDALTEREALDRLGVRLVECAIEAVEIGEDRITALNWSGGRHAFDLLYSALGTTPNADLARELSVALTEDDLLKVDAHSATSIPGFYAAGDVVKGLNQIAVATSDAALAATDIHNRLRKADGQTV
ncbi:NAD(P)/FAD-dependent oxidoreductase [Brevundimonas variabilis]